jgi:hypothetical protein
MDPPVKLEMTKRDKRNDKKRQEDWHFTLSFPNVSIGNPESSERLKKEWIPFFKGMTKKQGNDKKNGSPFSWG